LVALLAAGFAWWLLVPRRAQRPRIVAAVTAVPETPSPAPTPARVAPTPLATAVPSAPPTATPTPAIVFTPGAHAPELALIVDDCGQWIDTERAFVALPIPVTLSVLPDVRYTSTIASEAAGAGKGVMLHLPMETISGLNPGPGKVTTEMSDAQITARVAADLAQIPLAAGVNNHEGSKASADPRVMRDVMAVVAKHQDMFFIDSRTTAASVVQSVANADGVPNAARNVFLDNKASVAYTLGQLREAAAIARARGSAIAIGHPKPTTLEAVREAIPELQAAGIRFVLVRQLVTTASR
jgi:polysaccharide deacetylase 2 family uncharacterized protein YibQ